MDPQPVQENDPQRKKKGRVRLKKSDYREFFIGKARILTKKTKNEKPLGKSNENLEMKNNFLDQLNFLKNSMFKWEVSN